jgi:hypothetical protein
MPRFTLDFATYRSAAADSQVLTLLAASACIASDDPLQLFSGVTESVTWVGRLAIAAADAVGQAPVTYYSR